MYVEYVAYVYFREYNRSNVMYELYDTNVSRFTRHVRFVTIPFDFLHTYSMYCTPIYLKMSHPSSQNTRVKTRPQTHLNKEPSYIYFSQPISVKSTYVRYVPFNIFISGQYKATYGTCANKSVIFGPLTVLLLPRY